MNKEFPYFVQYHIERLDTPGQLGKNEVLQVHFGSFGQALQKLVATDKAYFDRQAAEQKGLDAYVSKAFIIGQEKKPIIAAGNVHLSFARDIRRSFAPEKSRSSE